MKERTSGFSKLLHPRENTGRLPHFFSFATVLLSINGTSITGTIRDAFDTFQALQFADFSNCELTGTIPSSIFDVPALELLYLNGNALTGMIPPNFGNANHLRDLYIYDNSIFGRVPSIQPGQLSNLTEFLLEENELTGFMPASVCALRDENTGDLKRLSADCDEIVCDCCTSCFPGQQQ